MTNKVCIMHFIKEKKKYQSKQISKPNYGANVVVSAAVVVGAAVVQQSEVTVKKLGQLSVPHSRFPAQSSSPSQSPSKSPHGFELEQHDHVSSVDQLHPAKLGSRSKNYFDYRMPATITRS